MKNKLLLGLLLLVITGCNDYKHISDTADIYYTRDVRNGLCFANKDSLTKDGYSVTSISNVDCTKINLSVK